MDPRLRQRLTGIVIALVPAAAACDSPSGPTAAPLPLQRETVTTSRPRWPSAAAVALIAALTVAACGSDTPGGPTPAVDFASQFDSLWTRFDREYSYFQHKHIDWNALRTIYRPRALAAGDQTAFIEVIREMLAELHDVHVVLRDPAGRTIPTYDPQTFTNWSRPVFDAYRARANWTQGQSDWGHGVLDGVPYIIIGGWGSSSIRAADFDMALERYRNAPAMILDVRPNSGGDDSLAFDIAARFTPSTITANYIQFRNGPAHTDFSPLTPRTVSPRGSWQYTGRVYLLIGRRCASSNESFIVAMGQLPHVTLAGDRTAGATANPGTFNLANGWTYTVSRWIEFTPDHQVIEDNGIAPDVYVAATAADFASGRDPVLDWALSQR